MIFLAKIGFQMDSTLPRDTMTISPHYFGDDAQALADRIKTNLIAIPEVASTTPFKISIYNAQAPPPSFPLATASQVVASPATSAPRELALCLSYYSTYNRPRYRGRLYIPVCFLGSGIGLRPTTTQITKALSWGNALGKGLPTGHNWVVYSRRNDQSYGVSNTWVDDEWDIIRTRGLKGTTRQTAPIP